MERIVALDKIEGVAREVLGIIGKKTVIAFHGLMGSGKTTFIRAMCQVLGVKDAVSSPTYSIINEYKGSRGNILHIDLYRLKNNEELMRAGVEDSLYSGNLCLVEWPELAFSLLPDDTVHIYLEAIDESTRRIRIGDN
ncbi:MAG: tRNA (adenosine(37)-N6)-threonylcarbamoyltransferase complex ATPase subunit type 1 TsaE [Chitinophagaceae bacterium]